MVGQARAFHPHVGLVGTGAVHFPAAVSPAQPVVTALPSGLSGSGPPPALDQLDFGTIQVGESKTLMFTVTNFAGGAAQPLVGAVQTAVNGANVTDPALSGSRVTPGNFHLPRDLAQQVFSVMLTSDTPHSLDGQAVHLAFPDGSGVTLPITGSIEAPEPVDWDALAAQVLANFAATGQWFF